jgi:hypothetical protein
LLTKSEKLTVECSCTHLSWFTVIEDLPIVNGVVTQEVVDFIEVPVFKDWITLLSILYLFVFLISGLMFARGRDKVDEQLLLDTDEPEETNKFPGEKENKAETPKPDLSLMTWLFNRRVLIEPYCGQNLASCFQNKENVRVTTWVLFKLYLSQLHSLLALSNHYDITVLRVDRLLVLWIKTLLVFEISQLTLG